MSGLFLTEDVEKDEDGSDYKILYAIASVGGISIHSTETFNMLNKLKLKK